MYSIIQTMEKFGFTAVETKVYITLLKNGNLTGYEISKRSGVARSKIYNILENLLKKKIILVNRNEPKLYHAISSEEFLENLQRNISSDLSHLTAELSPIKEEPAEETLWKIDNHTEAFNKASYLIKKSENSLLIQIWKEDINDDLLKLLQKAENKLDKFILILFSSDQDYTLPLKKYYRHGFETDKLRDLGGRWINVVADEKEVLFGTICAEDTGTDITWTQNYPFVNLSKEYIKHDAYTLKIVSESKEYMLGKYGCTLENIRNIY